MRFAVVGVTGVVGEMIFRVLDERGVQVDELGAFASRDRDVPLSWRNRSWPIRAATPQALTEGRYDVVMFAASEDAGDELARLCVKAGARRPISRENGFRGEAQLIWLIVRVERGTINRAIYQTAILHDPNTDPAPSWQVPPSAWNHRWNHSQFDTAPG